MPTKAKKAPTLKDEDTGLPIVGEGKELRLQIKSEAQAQKAVEAYASNEEELEKLLRKIAPLNAKREMIRAGMKVFQEGETKDDKIVDFTHDGWVSQLIERTNSMWILEDADIPENLDVTELDEPVKALDEIISEKAGDNSKLYRRLLNKVTRRVIDPNAIDAAVKDGTFTAEEVAPAFLEYVGTSYVQIKPDKIKK